MDSKVEPQRQVMRLRGRSYVAFVFSPFMPIMNWLEEIDATLAHSPGFFAGRPIVLDVSAVKLSSHGIAHLVSSLEVAAFAYSASKASRRVGWIQACHLC